VTSVSPYSAAERWNEQPTALGNEIRPGDIITQVNGDTLGLGTMLMDKNQERLEVELQRGQAWKVFTHEAKDLIRVLHDQEPHIEEEDAGVPSIYIEELKGVRVSAPMYRVPVIPYLQEGLAREGRRLNRTSSALTETAVEKAEPFVLLPSIIFQLKNCVAGTDYGTLMVGLNRLNRETNTQDCFYRRKSWIDIILEEHKLLDRSLKQWSSNTEKGTIHPVKGLQVDEDAYSVFVDVFATENGYLSFDSDFRIGRPLTEQRLFTISKSRMSADRDREVTQFFNSGDWMADNPAHESEPFDSRVAPSLWCGKWDYEEDWAKRWLMEEADVKKRCLPRKEMKLNKPKGPDELLQSTFGGLIGKASSHMINSRRNGEGERVKISKAKTGELRRELKSLGWRGTSHLIAPETDHESNTLVTDLVRSTGALRANLHTFMRPVGHVIHENDRDSRILARLRLGLPKKAMTNLKHRIRKDHEEAERALNEALNDENDEDNASPLRKSIELHEAQLNCLIQAEGQNANFLLVKFKKRGTVIWAAPNDVYHWPNPGMPLFIVQLFDQPDVNVPVFVPSFDIRQRFETIWTPIKTLSERWRHMENKIHQSEKKGKPAQTPELSEKRRKKRRAQVPGAMQDVEDPNSDDSSADEASETDVNEPNGYSRPIAVSKFAFVCRIGRRKGAVCFDRVQTYNWYQTVLEDTFGPDLEETSSHHMKVPHDKEVKDKFLSRFMNLQKPLVTRLDQTGTAMIKGHISCLRVKDPYPGQEVVTEDCVVRSKSEWSSKDYVSETPLPICTAPPTVQASTRAVENLWIQQRVFVHCCVLTGLGLEVGSLGLASYLKPYLVVQLGNEQPIQTDPSEDAVRQSGTNGPASANFYSNFVSETTLPGVAKLSIQVWHKGLLNDTLVGTCWVDLEDRWLTLKQRELRECSNEKYLRSNISPETVRYCTLSTASLNCDGWVDPPDDPEADCDKPGTGKEVMRPWRAPGQRMPIEFQDLLRVDEETATESRVGILRFWVDILPIGDHAAEDVDVYKPIDFEVRILIRRITNISVFRDYGIRNDVYVKGRIKTVDYLGKETVQSDKTDVHKFAHAEATFNWRWVFPVRAPAQECSLELRMIDENKITSHDAIYHPVVYSLDHMLNVAYTNAKESRRPLGVLQDTVVFDSWDEESPVESLFSQYCRCCWRRSKLGERKFAQMQMDVQIVPVWEAQLAPAEPGCTSVPKDRMTLATAISEPKKTLKIIVGSGNFYNIQIITCACITLVVSVLVLALVFFVANIGQIAQAGGGGGGEQAGSETSQVLQPTTVAATTPTLLQRAATTAQLLQQANGTQNR